MGERIGNGWFELDPDVFFRQPTKEKPAANYYAFFSPFDIPTAFRVIEEGDDVVVEFKYIGSPESLKNVNAEEGVVFSVGKHSKRLYKIYLNSKLRSNEGDFVVCLRGGLENTIIDFAGRKLGKRAQGSYSAIASGIKSHAIDLNKALSRACNA